MDHQANNSELLGELERCREALRDVQREHELLLGALPDMLLRVRRDGTYLRYKPPREFQPWKTETLAEIIGANVRDSVPPHVASQAVDAIHAAITTQRAQQFQFSLPCGSEFCHREARIVPAGGDEALIIIRDITQRRRAEQERDAYHRLAAAIGRIQAQFINKPAAGEVFDGVLAEALALTDSTLGMIAEGYECDDGTISFRALSLAGTVPETRESQALAALGERVLASREPLLDDVLVGDSSLETSLGLPLQHEGETIGVVVVANRPHGYSPDVAAHWSPFWSTCGTLLAASIHERRRREAEQQLAQQQQLLAHAARLTTVGQLAAELAHEITQPLGAISNFASAAATTLDAGPAVDAERLRHWNGKILEQASRAGQIIDRLRRFAQRHDPLREPHLLSDIVAEAIALTAAHARRHRVEVRCEVATDEALVVIADRVQIQQVVVNLVHNAIEAIDSAAAHQRQVDVQIDAGPHAAIVHVDDTGSGLPPDGERQVFEPFYTTKPHGMGMGLTICRSLVEAHRGSIHAVSRPTRGARFTFTLPRDA